MKVYRITKKKYADDISGKGAEIFGGRWNPAGIAALYTSQNRALAVLELLVHSPKELIPPHHVLLEIEIPKTLTEKILPVNELDKRWSVLQVEDWTQHTGLKYFRDYDALGIIVPSVIINMENNIVLNPAHKDYTSIKIIDSLDFKFDERLF